MHPETQLCVATKAFVKNCALNMFVKFIYDSSVGPSCSKIAVSILKKLLAICFSLPAIMPANLLAMFFFCNFCDNITKELLWNLSCATTAAFLNATHRHQFFEAVKVSDMQAGQRKWLQYLLLFKKNEPGFFLT